MSEAMKSLAEARKKHNNFKMKCIAPDFEGNICGMNPIESHSIQHNGILSRLAEEGKVYCLGETTQGDEIFEYDLKEKGITKQASIFKCLCNKHDKKLFVGIEDCEFNKEPQQCFQYALKALLHSYWSKCNDAGIVEKYKQTQIARQIIEDRKAYEMELNRFWEILRTEQYQDLLCYIVPISREINIAVSTSINICRKLDGTLFGAENDKYPLLHISAFPVDGKSYLLISCLKENEDYFKAFTTQFTLLSVETILKKFNVLLPLLAENIMISPRVVKKMNDAERKQLLVIFRTETMGLYCGRGININSWAEQVTYNLWI